MLRAAEGRALKHFLLTSPAHRGAFSLPIANRRQATIARRLNVPTDDTKSPGRRQAGRGFLCVQTDRDSAEQFAYRGSLR